MLCRATMWPAKRALRAKRLTAATKANMWPALLGFAPAKNPRLIVAVSIDEPVGILRRHGGRPRVPGIMEGGLKLLNVAPTYVNADKNVQTAQR